MNSINIHEVIARPEYTFLHKNERLHERIMFVTFGGSHAYGTNVEGSDIDVRGCVAATENELLGLEKFEQFLDSQTDTTIYAFPKLVGLLVNCNPNTIELLGCRPDSYNMVSPRRASATGQRQAVFVAAMRQVIRRLRLSTARAVRKCGRTTYA